MAHVTTLSSRADRWSPAGIALAALLHGLVALALWLIAMNPPKLPHPEEPITVTIEQPPPKPVEQPKPEPPKPPQTAPAQKPPAAIPPLGVAPPAEIEADKPSQKSSTAAKAQESTAPEPPSLEQSVPPPQQPPTEFAFPKAPTPQAKPAPPPPSPRFLPSPLHSAPRQQPPAIASKEPPQSSPFVNPADTYARARVQDNYLWQVISRLSGYQFDTDPNVPRRSNLVVRIVIARDGRLLDVTVARSSGYAQVDQGAIAGLKSGSPYAPLPDNIKGDSATFTLPLVAFTYP
jgi:TonB family protein